MSSPLPFVVRVAAGIVADAVDVVRRLPEELPGLPIALAGRAARVSMRLNQHLTDLAAKGDSALSGLPFGTADEEPGERTPWSRIDDEDVEMPEMPSADVRLPAEDTDAEDDGAPVGDPLNGDLPDDGAAGGIPGFDELTLSQLRHVLTDLTAAEVGELLEYEQSHQARASFLTLLTNRLTTLAGSDRP